MTIRTTLMPLSKNGEAYKPGETFFESNTPGIYTITPKTSSYCEATVVGAGAGGAYNSSSNRSSAAPGSSGSGCIVRIWLKANVTYTIKVGAGGVKNGGVDYNCWGGTGENSSISLNETPLISAPGGNGGHVWWPNSAAAAAQPEACTFADDNNNYKKIEVVMNERGHSGGVGTGSGGTSVLSETTYGKGGSATKAGSSSNASAGSAGYVKLVMVKVVKRYWKYARWLQPVMSENGIMGGNTFAVACSTAKDNIFEMLNAGAGGTVSVDTLPNAAPQWVSFYNPEPIKVTRIDLGQLKDNQLQYYYITAYEIQGSLDGEDWTTVFSAANLAAVQMLTAELPDCGFYHYYRIYVKSSKYYSGYPRVFFVGLEITSLKRIAGNSQDYDFIEYQFLKGDDSAETRRNLGGGGNALTS